jgi:hypothetical protein
MLMKDQVAERLTPTLARSRGIPEPSQKPASSYPGWPHATARAPASQGPRRRPSLCRGQALECRDDGQPSTSLAGRGRQGREGGAAKCPAFPAPDWPLRPRRTPRRTARATRFRVEVLIDSGRTTVLGAPLSSEGEGGCWRQPCLSLYGVDVSGFSCPRPVRATAKSGRAQGRQRHSELGHASGALSPRARWPDNQAQPVGEVPPIAGPAGE